MRINWRTVGRIIERVSRDELDPDRLNELFDIAIDEVSWRKQHRYLTLAQDDLAGQGPGYAKSARKKKRLLVVSRG